MDLETHQLDLLTDSLEQSRALHAESPDSHFHFQYHLEIPMQASATLATGYRA